jgi:hypothetical protein
LPEFAWESKGLEDFLQERVLDAVVSLDIVECHEESWLVIALTVVSELCDAEDVLVYLS